MTRKRPPARRGGGRSAAGEATAPVKRGPWTPEEDELLARYVEREGEGRWRTLPRRAGLLRCGKSCRLRWVNYLRPDIKRDPIADDEEDLILRLHRLLGNRWSLIAGRLPGRTDNEIKNYWNTHLSKKLIAKGIDPRTHRPLAAAGLSQDAATAAADKTAAPVEPPPPPPVQPTSYAAGTGCEFDGRASPVCDGGDVNVFAATTMSLDALGFEGLDDHFYAGDAARVGFDDMGCATMDDDAFSSFFDSLINDGQFDGQFVDYFVENDAGDHKNVKSETDQGGAS